jgi:hypothetical protein
MSKLTETLNSHLLEQSEHLQKLSIEFDEDLLDKNLLDQLSKYLFAKSSEQLIEVSFAIASTQKFDHQYRFIEQINFKSAKTFLDLISKENSEDHQRKKHKVDIPRWMILLLGSEVYDLNGKAPITIEDALNKVLNLCLNLVEELFTNNGKITKKAS